MTNKRNIIYILIAIATLTGSCSKDFLSTDPTTQISDQNLFKTLDGAQTLLNGMYRYQAWATNTAPEVGSIMSWQNGLDAAAKDIVVFQAQGYMQVYYNHFVLASTRADGTLPSGMWSYFFTLASNTNDILANIDGID